MWYLWILTKAIIMLCLFFLQLRLIVELIGVAITRKSILAVHIL
jgi:hypothetical protein